MNEFTKDSMSQRKPIFSAISPKFTLGMAEVLAFGAEKYGRDNWKQCSKDQMHLYWDAFERHVNAYKRGEENDQETGMSHISHAACNLMFIQELDSMFIKDYSNVGGSTKSADSLISEFSEKSLCEICLKQSTCDYIHPDVSKCKDFILLHRGNTNADVQ